MKTFPFPLNSPYGLLLTRIEIPREIQVPVALIYHELMNRMLFEHFRVIEMTCDLEHFQCNLILASLNMHDGKDETFKIYTDIMDHWAEKVTCEKDVVVRRALRIYYALIKARDKRKNKKIIPQNKDRGQRPRRKVSK